jgi:membrane-bound lytic murein transglycosylase F
MLPIFFINCIDKNAMKKINRLGEITVLTRNNAHCYYIYQNQEMGFEYDLAKAFADYLGVALKIRVTEWENLIKDISDGTGDIIAANMAVTQPRKNLVDFSNPYLTIQQMVIIHKDNNQIKEMKDLKRKTIHIRKGASYKERLTELNEEGFDMNIEEHHDLTTEELIRQVAEKEIEITIADSNIALLNRRYYPKIIIAFPIKQPRPLAWAVKKGEKNLLRKINIFFEKIKTDGTFATIYDQYYAGVEVLDYLDLRKFHKRIKTRLPAYKDVIKEAAEKNGFDWRLISAMIYQESHFDENAMSHTGVGGIMQLTQATADDMGVADRMDPVESITAGVKYLKKLYDRYEKAEGRDRIFITLASYNVGHGHITDAQKLAVKMGLDPYKWSSLEKTLPLLRCRRYYLKSENGYCRGAEPVRYVKRILIYYDILKRKAIEA